MLAVAACVPTTNDIVSSRPGCRLATIVTKCSLTGSSPSCLGWSKTTLSHSTQIRHRYQKRHSRRRTFRRRRRPHGGGHDRGDSRIREHRIARRKDHPHHPNPPGDPLAACPASGHCATHPRAPRQEHTASPLPAPRRRAESRKRILKKRLSLTADRLDTGANWRKKNYTKEFYNPTPSHDTGHGTGAHWHEHRYTTLEKEFLKYKPLSQHTGTTRARTGADWHTGSPKEKQWPPSLRAAKCTPQGNACESSVSPPPIPELTGKTRQSSRGATAEARSRSRPARRLAAWWECMTGMCKALTLAPI